MSNVQRITMSLDSGLVIEALILRRLDGLRGRRRQDWLRSLLGQGFLLECRWLRKDALLSARSGPSVGMPSSFARWLARVPSKKVEGARVETITPIRTLPKRDTGTHSKPFAHLRAVVG